MCITNDGWECLAKRDQVNPDASLTIESGQNGVGLYEVDDHLYALEDVCPHGAALLSRGFLWKGMVKCPLHGAVWDIKTGKCLQGPAERDLETYPVQLRGDDVYIQIKNS
jgi:nitrite reductase/ring-hydroxylating ferredoxin subunit